MNRENIKKVRDVIAALPPERFDMTHLFARGPFEANDEWVQRPKTFIRDCGTAACIAGWTLAVLHRGGGRGDLGTHEAGQLLGLEWEEAHPLFLPRDWSKAGRYTHAAAVRVLDHLLETGEVDWSIIDTPVLNTGEGL